MIPNEEECGAKSKGQWQWHYNAVKNVLVLSGITSKNNGDFYYL